MFAIVADPPDSGNCLQTGTAGTGGDLFAATFGTFFRFGYRLFGIFYILLFFFSSVYHP
jgi:hypothetical protein